MALDAGERIDLDRGLDNYPLMTYKLVYYSLWTEILNIIGKSEQITEKGFSKIISLKFAFKFGSKS